MSTGVLDCNQAANTFEYNRNGDQDIKGGAYRILRLTVGGVKKLLANVTTASFILTAPATLDLNGFTRN